MILPLNWVLSIIIDLDLSLVIINHKKYQFGNINLVQFYWLGGKELKKETSKSVSTIFT